MTVRVWVVLLEVADIQSIGGITHESVQRLLSCLGRHHASGLYARDRYALQLVIQKERPATAMDAAITIWHDALTQCRLPQWELVRAEVKTVGELEAELAAEAALMGTARPPVVEAHSMIHPTDTGEGMARETQAATNGLRCGAFTLGRAYPMP